MKKLLLLVAIIITLFSTTQAQLQFGIKAIPTFSTSLGDNDTPFGESLQFNLNGGLVLLTGVQKKIGFETGLYWMTRGVRLIEQRNTSSALIGDVNNLQYQQLQIPAGLRVRLGDNYLAFHTALEWAFRVGYNKEGEVTTFSGSSISYPINIPLGLTVGRRFTLAEKWGLDLEVRSSMQWAAPLPGPSDLLNMGIGVALMRL